MKAKHLFPFLLLTFLLLAGSVLLLPDTQKKIDTVAVNRIMRILMEQWPEPTPESFSGFPYDFSVADHSQVLLFRFGENASATLAEAVERGDLILDLPASLGDGGKVYIHTGMTEDLLKNQKQVFFTALGFSLLFPMTAFFCWLYFYRRLLLPFKRLRSFAKNIAQGNLDVPLKMDRHNLFGPFTESFDLMRDQLAKARTAEALANQSKKELVAALSHDIKTPVTSIKLISELLQVTIPDEYREKCATIYNKAEQVDRLVTNLFQSAMEELGQLDVRLTETASSILDEIFKNANYYGKLSNPKAPECLLSTDPLRLEQVIDNIVNNSYKYANTDVKVTYDLTDEFLEVTIRDFGPGVSDEELDRLFDKFYRGQSAIDSRREGSGLGLYISKYLMERMNGEISCAVPAGGFVAVLLIPLV